jgi:hypothetical protein
MIRGSLRRELNGGLKEFDGPWQVFGMNSEKRMLEEVFVRV